MKSPAIPYRSGYRHQIGSDYVIQTPIYPDKGVVAKWASISKDGVLTIVDGFGSDGTSFLENKLQKIRWIPGIKKIINLLLKGSFTHDALYYLFKFGGLHLSHRPMVDAFARELWIKSGAWVWFADLALWCLKKFGGTSALPENKRSLKWAK